MPSARTIARLMTKAAIRYQSQRPSPSRRKAFLSWWKLGRSSANGITKDKAAITTSWSNGQTEDQITKLKLVKRQTCGRAKLDLLHEAFIAAPFLLKHLSANLDNTLIPNSQIARGPERKVEDAVTNVWSAVCNANNH